MTDPEFLEPADVFLIHEEQLARYGGSAGLRDQGLLESAIGMPQATFGSAFVHEDLFAMAAAYASTSAGRRAARVSYPAAARGISSQVRPSSSRPFFFFWNPPHCLKKNGTLVC